MISIGVGVAIIILASGFVRYVFPAWFGQQPSRHRWHAQPQQLPGVNTKALETYERLAKEKLDVIKTALAMGYGDKELAELDARLEKLVGKDALQQILRDGSPSALASADLLDTQLDKEVERLRRLRDKQG